MGHCNGARRKPHGETSWPDCAPGPPRPSPRRSRMAVTPVSISITSGVARQVLADLPRGAKGRVARQVAFAEARIAHRLQERQAHIEMGKFLGGQAADAGSPQMGEIVGGPGIVGHLQALAPGQRQQQLQGIEVIQVVLQVGSVPQTQRRQPGPGPAGRPAVTPGRYPVFAHNLGQQRAIEKQEPGVRVVAAGGPAVIPEHRPHALPGVQRQALEHARVEHVQVVVQQAEIPLVSLQQQGDHVAVGQAGTHHGAQAVRR